MKQLKMLFATVSLLAIVNVHADSSPKATEILSALERGGCVLSLSENYTQIETLNRMLEAPRVASLDSGLALQRTDPDFVVRPTVKFTHVGPYRRLFTSNEKHKCTWALLERETGDSDTSGYFNLQMNQRDGTNKSKNPFCPDCGVSTKLRFDHKGNFFSASVGFYGNSLESVVYIDTPSDLRPTCEELNWEELSLKTKGIVKAELGRADLAQEQEFYIKTLQSICEN